MAARRHTAAQIFLFPAIVAVVLAFGLASALLGDGVWDAVSWVALAFPLVLLAFFLCRRAR